MSYPRGIVKVLIIMIITSELANGFIKFGSTHLLQQHACKRNVSFLDSKEIEQPLDHYDSSEKRTFKMQYTERLDFWFPNGPIYVYISFMECHYPKFITDEQSILSQMAKDTNGALLAMAVRYYQGGSPDIQGNLTEYYKFLSFRQQLGDYANLIRSVKSDPKFKSSKVVVVGHSYAGNLAAWLRQLYPDLVDAAIAASAPLLAQKDFKEFYEASIYLYVKYGSKKCLNNIETYFKRIEKLIQTSDGIETLKKELNICPSTNLTVLENKQYFFSQLYENFGFHFENPSMVKHFCNQSEPRDMFTMDLMHRAKSVRLRPGCGCWDINFNASHFTLPYYYQICTEYGHLHTTTSEKGFFVHWNPVEFVVKFCKDLIKGDIEKRLDEGVARTNKMYGGKHPNVTKVVFTHGDMDPLHTLGVLQDLGPDAPATIVNGTSEGAVLMVQDDEPEDLKINREYVKDLIKKWISTP